MLIIATISTAVAMVLADRMPMVFEQFRPLFKGFGADLPAITKLVVSHPKVFWVFAGLSFATFVWVAIRGRVSEFELAHMKLALRLTIALTVLAYSFAACALYAPIFRPGAVV
jgi:hypothetical protein